MQQMNKVFYSAPLDDGVSIVQSRRNINTRYLKHYITYRSQKTIIQLLKNKNYSFLYNFIKCLFQLNKASLGVNERDLSSFC